VESYESDVLAAQAWDERIGPFYDTAGLSAWLGISKQALNDRVRRRRMLAVTTADGRVVYPARQFDGRQLVAGLADALAMFRGAPVDGWAIAAWLATPAAALRGKTPLDWLHHGDNPQRVARLAGRPPPGGRRDRPASTRSATTARQAGFARVLVPDAFRR
jgi:hypothetical protein